ncbi:MAG TPA: FeoA family protein [Anaeromyxobacter sp.]
MVPLGLLSEGEAGEIVAVRGAGGLAGRASLDARAEDMGLRVGKRVEMLAKVHGSVLVKVDESRIAVGRAVAMRIVVRR